jgi:hypothetical protein
MVEKDHQDKTLERTRIMCLMGQFWIHYLKSSKGTKFCEKQRQAGIH